MWEALGKFMGGLAVGDLKAAADALKDEPAAKPAASADAPAAAEKVPGKGCGARDGDLGCLGHSEDGACIMGRWSAAEAAEAK